MSILVLVPRFRPIFNHILGFIETIPIKVAGLIGSKFGLTAAVIQHMLEWSIPQAEKMANKGFCFSVQLAHNLLKFIRKINLILRGKILHREIEGGDAGVLDQFSQEEHCLDLVDGQSGCSLKRLIPTTWRNRLKTRFL